VAVIGVATSPSIADAGGQAQTTVVQAQTTVVRPNPVARPLIDAPAALMSEASEPCVLYTCAANPQLHVNWENTLGALPTNYCTQYECSPMDLIPVHGFDDNLFPLNPEWAYTIECAGATSPSSTCRTGPPPPDANRLCHLFVGQAPDLGTDPNHYLGPRPCSRQPVSVDGPGGPKTAAHWACPRGREPYASFHGHINWEPATYEGTLEWDSHSNPGTDDDYSLNLLTDGGAGATAAAPAGVHIEFDSDETIDHFDGNPWWKQFHHDVDESESLIADGLQSLVGVLPDERDVNGHRAVVTGEAGLDTAHDPALELHPVYAMAIQTNRKAAVAGGTDKWALFARSWGNEGFCSHEKHPLPKPGPLTVRIPWQNGATGVLAGIQADPARQVQITKYDLSSDISPSGQMTSRVLPGEGVLLTFDLSQPASTEPRYWGTVDLKWTFGPPPILGAPGPSEPLRTSPATRGAKTTAPSDDGEKSDVEALVARLWGRLPRATRLKVLARIPTPFFKSATRPVVTMIEEPPSAPLRPFAAFVAPAANPLIIAQGRAELRALCAAYRNHVPGYPRMCRSVRRK